MNKSINARQRIIQESNNANKCNLYAMKYRGMKLNAFMSEMGAKGQHAEQLKIQLKDQINICLVGDKLQNYIKETK